MSSSDAILEKVYDSGAFGSVSERPLVRYMQLPTSYQRKNKRKLCPNDIFDFKPNFKRGKC